MRTLCLTLLAFALAAAEVAPLPLPLPAPVKPVPVAEKIKSPLPPSPPALDPAVAELKTRLPAVPAVVERDGKLWWQGKDASQAVAFTGVDDLRQPLVATVCGTVMVQRRLIEEGRTDALAALLTLAPLAKAAGISEGLRLAEGPLTGLHLRSSEYCVLPGGVLTAAKLAAPDRSAEVKELKAAIEVLKGEMPSLGLDEPARRAMIAVLDKLPLVEHSGDIDDATPDFLRRVVRSGWLRQFFPTVKSDERIEEAVRLAARLQPVTAWRGESGELAEVRDAFNRSGWVLKSTARSAWLTENPEPVYFGGMPAMVTVVELAPGSDPLAVEAEKAIRGVRTWKQAETDWMPVGAWTPERGLDLPVATWNATVPRRNRSPNVSEWMPAHLLVLNPLGDVLALATPHGTVRPPRDAGAQEGERFLAESAKALPDAAHLDLIGQYLLRYVYDSPDPRRPTLIGSKTDKGDIHQTALQTLATTAGGMFRGDCDDLAELYETIAERQGRTAHVIGVPGHAACAWAEKRADAWHVFVLQTGPALEFADADLGQALGKAYKHFDDSDTYDPNGLDVLLRFTNENVRGPWRLSYRIFGDPEYARIMIDVQRDWHYSTYQRGITKMLKLIESSESERNETANYRELSGLFSFTGQYALAAEYHQKAIDLTAKDPLSSLYMNVELIGHLFDAGKDHRAREVALDLLERQLPAQTQALGASLMQVSAQLAGTLAAHKARDLALRALKPGLASFNDRLVEALGRKQAKPGQKDPLQHPVAGLNALGDWLESPEFDENLWDNHPALQQFRRLGQVLAATSIACLDGSSQADLTSDADLQQAARFAQVWLDRVAFRDIDDPGEVLSRYATAGRAYATLLGSAERFQALLDAAPPPAVGAEPPRRRVGGIAQVVLDAGWIKTCPPYWTTRLMEMFERDKDAFDAKAALALADQALAASKTIRGTPLDSPRLTLQAHCVGLIRAMIAKDEVALRKHLKQVKERNDKEWYDQSSQWIGDCARRLDPVWFGSVLKAWDEEVHYEPKYFWIAWRAALGKAPKHAVMAAELAVKTFPNNPAFVDELNLMKQVVESKPPK